MRPTITATTTYEEFSRRSTSSSRRAKMEIKQPMSSSTGHARGAPSASDTSSFSDGPLDGDSSTLCRTRSVWLHSPASAMPLVEVMTGDGLLAVTIGPASPSVASLDHLRRSGTSSSTASSLGAARSGGAAGGELLIKIDGVRTRGQDLADGAVLLHHMLGSTPSCTSPRYPVTQSPRRRFYVHKGSENLVEDGSSAHMSTWRLLQHQEPNWSLARVYAVRSPPGAGRTCSC